MRRPVFAILVLAAGACSKQTPVTTPAPAPARQTPNVPGSPPAVRTEQLPGLSEPLPPIPSVDGPLSIKVVYPGENAPRASVDSNYMIGSVGNGQAKLTINGQPATVYPNGAFMAYVKQPPVTTPKFDLVATLGADTARLTHDLRVPPVVTPLPLDGKLIVDSSEFAPRKNNTLVLQDSERTTIRIRIPANAEATLVSRGGVEQRLNRNGEIASLSVPAAALRGSPSLRITRGTESVTIPIGSVRSPLDSLNRSTWIRLGRGVMPNDSDAVIYGRVLPNDNYKWFLLPGTTAEMTGRNGAGYTRIRVAEDLEMWVADADVDSVPAAAVPVRTTSNGRVRSTALSADLVIPMSSVPAYFVEEHNRQIDLVMYGVHGNTDIINYPTADTLIKSVTWEQETADRIRFTLHLTQRPVGYMALWERGSFVFRVRRAPSVDPAHPLRGRVIALDPGHPPAGATGPTSLYEGQVSLWVAQKAKAMLEEKGATVVMTRMTMDPLDLAPRRVTSRRADADAFVSIHLNAFPDGVNPFVATTGSGTYFFRTHAEPLARTVQSGLVKNLSLHDEGAFYRSLAVTVQTWMPAILTEGAYVIMPDQEAALRTENYQARYAKAIVDGLEAYFRGIGR
jgi:N-acetylmuramoyl-L-alanine amidase